MTVYGDEPGSSGLAAKLIEAGYTVDLFVTKTAEKMKYENPSNPGSGNEDIYFTYRDSDEEEEGYYLVDCHIRNGANIITPKELYNKVMGDYGVIYFGTHGSYHNSNEGGITIPLYANMDMAFLYDNWSSDFFYYDYIELPYYFEADDRPNEGDHNHNHNPESTGLESDHYLKAIAFTPAFFEHQKLENSIVFVSACRSWKIHEECGLFSNAKVYLGFDIPPHPTWRKRVSYYYFSYLMYGFQLPMASLYSKDFSFNEENGIITINTPDGEIIELEDPGEIPMSVKTAHEYLEKVKMIPDPRSETESYEENYPDSIDCRLEIDTQNGENDNTYFPVPVTVIVSEDEF